MKYLSCAKNVHFVGIGGIGMSAIAQVLIKRDISVSGSDVSENRIVQKLKAMGAQITIGHDKENVGQAVDLLVYSSCIRPDNPEMEIAKKRNIPMAARGDILAELMDEKIGVAVAGTHGKTTTSSLIGVILKDAGLDPTALIGGEVESLGGNAFVGEGEHLVAETDESDGSFLALSPTYSVITNIDEDHLDYHKDKKGLIEAFSRYAAKTKPQGCLLYWHDEPRKNILLENFKGESISFGLNKGADITADNLDLHNNFTNFLCFKSEKRLGEVRLNISGVHNVINSLAAIGVALHIGVDFTKIKKSLENFSGIQRRFQIKGVYKGVMLVEDYAHHPTEIKSVLAQARLWNPGRLISVFQPHRYTRTLQLKREFSRCFDSSDYLILTDIYPAGEKPIEGVSGRTIFESVKVLGYNKPAEYLSMKDISTHVCKIAKEGDSILILGAGNINSIIDELAKGLQSRD